MVAPNQVVSMPLKHDIGDAVLPTISPTGLVSSSTLASAVEKTRKYSPLTDLIESEKTYVELLTGIIRKVAAAWSRSNLPPQELDVVFRSVEGVCKTNRALLSKLEEIGENPSSPKVLGDLLMRWIDELEQPYATYADSYCIGFDDWGLVKSNPKLPAVIHTFSVTSPPPSSLPQSSHLQGSSLWTLDALFLLPKKRLQYYRKLYSRLLKGTMPGRSDHRLLTGALGKLDGLLATLDDRANITVDAHAPPRIALPRHTSDSAAAIPMETPSTEPIDPVALLSGQFGSESLSTATSIRGSSSSRDECLSQDTVLTSLSGKSSQTMSSPVLDLEKRLATERTLDIFTMQPKQIRLQIAPPTLPYIRELRLSVKAVVRFTSRATGIEVIHQHGLVYILSDLFLLCEEIPREERIARGDDGPDIRLCYPPLSGKVLNVIGIPGQSNALQVSIMRKETLILEADSQLKRDRILNEFQECISFAKTISRTVQEPIPPIPPIPPISPMDDLQSPATRLETSRKRPDRALNPRFLSRSQSSNVQSEPTDDDASVMDRTPTVTSAKQNNGLPVKQARPIFTQLEMAQDSRSNVASCPPSNPTSPKSAQGASTFHNPDPMYPPRRSSTSFATNNTPSSIVPAQFVPPVRSTSVQSRSPPFVIPALGLPRGSDGMHSPPNTQYPARNDSTLRHNASMHSLRQQPVQRQLSLHSPTPRSNHHDFTIPHPRLTPQSSNEQPFDTFASEPSVNSHPIERSQSYRRLQKSQSSRSLHTHYQHRENPLPPVPSLPSGFPVPRRPHGQHKDSIGSQSTQMSGPLLLPSMQMGSRSNSVVEPSILDPSPPTSPVDERKPLEPARSVITAQMKCKVFHQQQHAQWKPLGSANLTLYHEEPTNVKQLVVAAGSKDKSILISTIVLTDGVERVGKTGVAIELSDAGGARTGVIYMIQLRNEDSASRFYKSLLEGSDRAT